MDTSPFFEASHKGVLAHFWWLQDGNFLQLVSDHFVNESLPHLCLLFTLLRRSVGRGGTSKDGLVGTE